MAMVGQALVPRGRSWAVRLVSLAAGLFGVVLLAAYTANLAAILTDTSASTSIKRSVPCHTMLVGCRVCKLDLGCDRLQCAAGGIPEAPLAYPPPQRPHQSQALSGQGLCLCASTSNTMYPDTPGADQCFSAAVAP